MIILWLLLPLISWSAQPPHWAATIKISERHEFYTDNEVIQKPANTWQLLFALNYPDKNLQMRKDCVFYRVPGVELGIMKVNQVAAHQKCESFLDHPGEIRIENLKSLQFSLNQQGIALLFTDGEFRSSKWEARFLNYFERPVPEQFMSSAELRGPRIVFLSDVDSVLPASKKLAFLKDGELCHGINDQCEETSPSVCGQCPEGWYEIPNGCSQGPKYCGVHRCGGKNQPACRRGMKWQREAKTFDCRTDSSFAYCAPGMSLQCEGALAFCR